MNKEKGVPFLNKYKKIILLCLAGILLFSAGIGAGLLLQPQADGAQSGYAANPSHEYLVGAAAWQMSAEAHALMMQGFHLAEENIDEISGHGHDIVLHKLHMEQYLVDIHLVEFTFGHNE